MIVLQHGRISWAEDAEPPYRGKIHIILKDDQRDENDCRLACGSDNWAGGAWYCDFTDEPVTCKSCLCVKPETIEAARVAMEKEHDD